MTIDPGADLAANTAIPGHAPSARIPGYVFAGLACAAAVVARVMLLADLERTTVGYLVIVLLLLALALGIPIGIAMILTASVGLTAVLGYGVTEASVREMLFDGVAQWSLSVVPLFVVMGIAMWRSGLSGNAYSAARHWIGW